ncbi:hypothetical protein [Bacillus safensis]|uniref:hypothetical protein n=1 Tax=Bacillus safensis TaxID=561879 RepID=UPI003252579A
MNIEPRQAFRAFMKYQLENGEAVAELGLKKEDIEKFILNAEDDMFFFDKIDDFLKEYIEDFGENYGIDIPLEE